MVCLFLFITTLSVSFVIYLLRKQEPIRGDYRPNAALGQVMAEETVKLLRGHGRVLVIYFKNSRHALPSVEVEMKAFRRSLSESKVSIAAEEPMGLEDLEESQMSGAVLLGIFKKYDWVDAIVSFVGATVFTDAEVRLLSAKLPKVVMFSPHGRGMKRHFEDDVVQVAIVPRVDDGASEKTSWFGWLDSEKTRRCFDRYYRVITKANVETL